MSIVRVWCDGACRKNGQRDAEGNFVPTEGALGIVIYRNNQLVGQYARGLGNTTNNGAEYEALLCALLMCWSNPELKDPIIYSDSTLVVNQVNRKWRCRTVELRPLLLSIWEILDNFRCRIEYVSRKDPGLRQADKLANLMLDAIALDKQQFDSAAVKTPRKQKRDATTEDRDHKDNGEL